MRIAICTFTGAPYVMFGGLSNVVETLPGEAVHTLDDMCKSSQVFTRKGTE